MNVSLKRSCEFNLAFPYTDDAMGPKRLSSLQAFAEAREYSTEFFLDGPATQELESRIAAMFGKPAALWCPTGILAQSIAARIYAERRGSKIISLHPTSHLLLHEERGYELAHGLTADVMGRWDEALTAEDLSPNTACAFIELPQRHNGGLLPDWDELQAIKLRAREFDLPLHMDGARIWSCRPFYNNRSFEEIARGFSSVYVSLYKDIGALGGAVLVGDKDFIADAKLWRARLGGLTAAAWPLVLDGLRLLEERLPRLSAFVSRAKEIAKIVDETGVLSSAPSPPQTNMFHVRLPYSSDQAEQVRDDIARQTSVWIGGRFWELDAANACALEMNVGDGAMRVPDEKLKTAFELLADEARL